MFQPGDTAEEERARNKMMQKSFRDILGCNFQSTELFLWKQLTGLHLIQIFLHHSTNIGFSYLRLRGDEILYKSIFTKISGGKQKPQAKIKLSPLGDIWTRTLWWAWIALLEHLSITAKYRYKLLWNNLLMIVWYCKFLRSAWLISL